VLQTFAGFYAGIAYNIPSLPVTDDVKSGISVGMATLGGAFLGAWKIPERIVNLAQLPVSALLREQRIKQANKYTIKKVMDGTGPFNPNIRNVPPEELASWTSKKGFAQAPYFFPSSYYYPVRQALTVMPPERIPELQYATYLAIQENEKHMQTKDYLFDKASVKCINIALPAAFAAIAAQYTDRRFGTGLGAFIGLLDDGASFGLIALAQIAKRLFPTAIASFEALHHLKKIEPKPTEFSNKKN